jgi:hypothetical protein
VPNLALIALGDSHHSQGGMKFATQISPLLNLFNKKDSEGLNRFSNLQRDTIDPLRIHMNSVAYFSVVQKCRKDIQ